MIICGVHFVFATPGQVFGFRFCSPLPLGGQARAAHRGALWVLGSRGLPSSLQSLWTGDGSTQGSVTSSNLSGAANQRCEDTFFLSLGGFNLDISPFWFVSAAPCPGAGWARKALTQFSDSHPASARDPLPAKVCFSPWPRSNLPSGWWGIHQHGLRLPRRLIRLITELSSPARGDGGFVALRLRGPCQGANK